MEDILFFIKPSVLYLLHRCAVISVISGILMAFSCSQMEGQYINIFLPGEGQRLQLCEVRVYTTTHIKGGNATNHMYGWCCGFSANLMVQWTFGCPRYCRIARRQAAATCGLRQSWTGLNFRLKFPICILNWNETKKKSAAISAPTVSQHHETLYFCCGQLSNH